MELGEMERTRAMRDSRVPPGASAVQHRQLLLRRRRRLRHQDKAWCFDLEVHICA